ncbi:transcription elongation factor SPT5 isoform X2 [Ischnura elegans]|uniref:transcription elongation factor SPT5 isoform X2 n=1 Tax=Ischnura elegans TaxID=197161 RepID=UPI001ED87D7D|nr:transcription elongation factor SPT5 isoform X2 [Ischnura elegans]
MSDSEGSAYSDNESDAGSGVDQGGSDRGSERMSDRGSDSEPEADAKSEGGVSDGGSVLKSDDEDEDDMRHRRRTSRDDDEDEEEDDEEVRGRRRRSSSGGQGVDDDEAEEAAPGEEEEEGEEEPEPEGEDLHTEDEEEDDDEIDEEEEEDEDDEDDRPRKRRKKGRDRFGGFIIDEAEVDDENEDEEEWEAGAEGAAGEILAGIVGNEVDEVGPTAREIEGRRRRGHGVWDSRREDEIEEYLRRKYADGDGSIGDGGGRGGFDKGFSAARRFGDGGEDLSDEITQQTLLPGVKDPNLWLVRCRIGEEKTTALLLMRKYIAYQFTSEPLQIKSVVAPEGLKGYIYIESYKQTHVKHAIENVGNLRMGQWKQQMVAIKEMTDVLRVVKEKTGLKPKQWVRLKRGLYKDDIAQVDYVDLAQNQVHLKLLPRIDYTRPRGALRTSQADNEDNKRKKKRRPPAKPFDPEAIRAIGGEVASDGDFLIFEGNRYSRKGFLYKNFTMSAIISDGVKPTLSELERFEEAPEGVELELPAAGTKGLGSKGLAGLAGGLKDDAAHSFSTGDNVEVCEGELLNLQGKILAIDGAKITVMPKHEDLKEPLEFQASELKKHFRMGDHVRVLSGRYEGDTGLIVRVEENRIVLFSDLTMHELEVLPRDLQLCSDMATGVDSLGQFQWGDLVQLDPQTVGVIVRLERESFHILSMHGKVVEAKPQALHKRKESRNAVALDSCQNTIQRRDIVKAIDGPHAGRYGEIKHLYRSFAFLHSRLYLENGGILVCKTRHLQLAGGSKNTNNSSITGTAGFMSPRISSPMHPSGGGRGGGGGGGGGGGRGRGRGMGMRRDQGLIGQTIKITGGPYKGNVGIVKDATDSTARVELHCTCQTISVDRSHIANVGVPNKEGSYSTYNRTTGYGITGIGGNTPMYGAKTPMHGSQTPMYDAGSRTPHFGSMTPSHDGSRTPGQAGAWDPTVTNTPARSASGGDFDTYSMDDDGTPGYQPETPQGPYTPQTPGTMYGSDHSYSPYPPSGSPSPSGYQGTPSPSAYVPTPSPGGGSGTGRGDGSGSGGYQTSPSPSAAYGTPSPLGYSPMTPGASSPYNPQTPGAGMEQAALVEWHTTDIEVRIKDTHDDPGLTGQTGVINGISGGNCSVFLPEEDRVVNIVSDHLEPIVPQRGDQVKVIMGEDREAVGQLLSIDNQEGVVKLAQDEVKMLQLRFLCRMKSSRGRGSSASASGD